MSLPGRTCPIYAAHYEVHPLNSSTSASTPGQASHNQSHQGETARKGVGGWENANDTGTREGTTYQGATREIGSSSTKSSAHSLPPLFRLSDVIGEVVAQATAAHEAHVSHTPLGPITGLERTDERLGGAFSNGLTMLLGNTGAGKTAFALQASFKCRCPALLVSCEMSPAELMRRMMANVCSKYLNYFKSGELHPDEVKRMAIQTAEAAPLLALMDATRDYASPGHIIQVADALRADHKHLLIIVDSLQSWVESAGTGAMEYEALNAGLAALRRVSHLLNCPIIVVCERNRAGIESGGVNSGAGTRRIEYGAEAVLDLHRDKDAMLTGSGEVPVTLRFAKNRHGAAGQTVNLHFNGALQRFKEV